MAKLAIIRIRGQVRNNPKRHTAMNLLGLEKKFSAIIVEDTPTMRNQIKRINPDVTWGEINEDLITTIEKRTKAKVYHFNPPKGGLGRKGLKFGYNKKGATGNRGNKINDMLKKMI